MARSWWLKLDRAESHFEEVKHYIDAYEEAHSYHAFLGKRTKRKPHIWPYHLRIDDQPDPMIAVVIGEILYDFRSALDHLACSLNPRARRDSAFYPIQTRPIWDTNADGTWVLSGPEDDKARQSFSTATKGMAARAVTLIKSAQPYQLRDAGEPAVLDLLNRLENKDKHQELVVLSSFIEDISAHVIGAWGDDPVFCGACEDGTELFQVDWYRRGGRRIPPEAEVDVQIRGTPRVSIKVGGVEGHGTLPFILENMSLQVRHICTALEPYLKS